jgi:hypothetical protein
MSRVELVNARLVHTGPLSLKLRDIDRRECEAFGHHPKRALRLGLRLSLNPLTVLIDGQPEAMLGVVPTSMIAGKGIVWMLGSDEIPKHRRDLALIGPRLMEWLARDMPHLENLVSIENEAAISFMKHLGFEVSGITERHGGLEFVPFKFDRAIQGVKVSG